MMSKNCPIAPGYSLGETKRDVALMKVAYSALAASFPSDFRQAADFLEKGLAESDLEAHFVVIGITGLCLKSLGREDDSGLRDELSQDLERRFKATTVKMMQTMKVAALKFIQSGNVRGHDKHAVMGRMALSGWLEFNGTMAHRHIAHLSSADSN